MIVLLKPYIVFIKKLCAVTSKLSKIFWLFLATLFVGVAKVRAVYISTKLF
jgi:hypothetical protein